MMNGLQAVESWQTCKSLVSKCETPETNRNPCAVFNHPRSAILGLLSALYSLGSICSLPFVPFVTDRLGRRWAIIMGSIIMMIGAILQTASQDCT